MKAYQSLVLAVVLALVCAPLVTAQTQVTIQNPSFESPAPPLQYSNSNGTYNYNATGWSITGTAGLFNPNSGFYTPLDGANVAWAQGGTLSQDTGVTYQANSTYTLSVQVTDNFALSSSIHAILTLSAGSTEICSSTTASTDFLFKAFLPLQLQCNIGASPPSGNVVIGLGSDGSQISFDTVALSYVSNTSHHASLTWQDSLNPSGTTYNVYRSLGGTWNPVLLANVSTLNYTDTTIVTGQPYVYTVTAVNANGQSAPSNPTALTLGVQ